MECSICYNKMTGSGDNVFTTPCGHMYHEKCLKDWMRQPNSECPNCRKAITLNTIIQVFLDTESSGLNEQLLLTRLADININIEARDKNNADIFTQLSQSLEKITISMSSFEYQNEMLRKENAEMKQLIKALENENKLIGLSRKDAVSLKEQMKAKDIMIANLQKEVSDMKTQRLETTGEMKAIQEKINQLKAAAKGEKKRDPLRDINDRGQSLTLKFDDFNDKVIVE